MQPPPPPTDLSTCRTIPLPDLAGINVSPNCATSVGLTKEQIRRLPPPYPSRCAADWAGTNLTVSPTPGYSLDVGEAPVNSIILQSCRCV